MTIREQFEKALETEMADAFHIAFRAGWKAFDLAGGSLADHEKEDETVIRKHEEKWLYKEAK